MKLWAFICSVIAMMIFWLTCGILLSQYISDTVVSIMQFVGIFTSYQLLYYGFWIKSKEKNKMGIFSHEDDTEKIAEKDRQRNKNRKKYDDIVNYAKMNNWLTITINTPNEDNDYLMEFLTPMGITVSLSLADELTIDTNFSIGGEE